jgi:hypothetical protein
MGIMDKITGRFRKSSGGGESSDVSQHGYPEQAPAGSEAGGERPLEEMPQREGADAGRKHPDDVVESDDGKATGNPHAAG